MIVIELPLDRWPYALKIDVGRFLPSIDHELLKGKLSRRIKDRRVLRALFVIIDGSPEMNAPAIWFAGDDLFAPLDRRRGIPIGMTPARTLVRYTAPGRKQGWSGFTDRCHQSQGTVMNHDQNFKNLVLDYPREALAFFAAAEAEHIDADARVTPSARNSSASAWESGFGNWIFRCWWNGPTGGAR